MTKLRSAVSNIVSELMLLVITLVLVTVVYAWVNNILLTLGEAKLPPMPQITNIYIATPKEDYSHGFFIAIVMRAPLKSLTIDGVAIYNDGKVVCSIDKFAISSDDPTASQYDCKALRVAGYYGEEKMRLDQYDAKSPGTFYLNATCQAPAYGEANSTTVGLDWFSVVGPDGRADDWATVVSGTPYVFLPSPSTVETYFSPATSRVSFVGGPLDYVKAFYNSVLGDWVKVPEFDKAKVSQGTFTIILWCKELNWDDVMNMKIRVYTNVYTVEKQFDVFSSS